MSPPSQKNQRIIYWLLCIAFGGTFVYTGFLKVWELGPIKFTDDIRSFHLLSDPWVAWLAMSLPWLEILCGAAVMTGILRRGGLLLLSMLLLVFLGAFIQAWIRGINPSCGCFGHTGLKTEVAAMIALDLILLAAAKVLSQWGHALRESKREP